MFILLRSFVFFNHSLPVTGQNESFIVFLFSITCDLCKLWLVQNLSPDIILEINLLIWDSLNLSYT